MSVPDFAISFDSSILSNPPTTFPLVNYFASTDQGIGEGTTISAPTDLKAGEPQSLSWVLHAYDTTSWVGTSQGWVSEYTISTPVPLAIE